ncbi:biliverdin-producing heme oxygenase [Coralloluteibacterium thermophilus]|uniref:Biliverdin-producing heme oxygenase n=1 Tax=Coralloluteibacterium thermophilum TaxID=2707049 RepID=A0ABV9NPY9_9GAMM
MSDAGPGWLSSPTAFPPDGLTSSPQPPVAPASDRHGLLRRATAPLHARAEALADALGARTRQAGYRRFLRAMYRFHRAAESALARQRADGAPAAWDAAGARLIAADLDALGEPLPPAAPALDGDGPGRGLGIRYVIEGSSLGARVLLPAVRALAMPEAGATRFLAAHAADAGRWRRFQALLRDADLDTTQERLLAIGAVDAFGSVVHSLEEERREAMRHG